MPGPRRAGGGWRDSNNIPSIIDKADNCEQASRVVEASEYGTEPSDVSLSILRDHRVVGFEPEVRDHSSWFGEKRRNDVTGAP